VSPTRFCEASLNKSTRFCEASLNEYQLAAATVATPTPNPRASRPSQGSMRSSAWLLVPVSSDGCPPCTPGLSTWSSSRSLHPLRDRRPHLAEGFTLRCLQRLSGPHVATQRYPEQDNWHTRGASLPILSY